MASSLAVSRRRVGYGIVIALALPVAWVFLPDLPVGTPRASAAMKEAGQKLFTHEWTPNDSLAGGDGLGPVFNARSCAACHFQGGIGGGGNNKNNVLAFEAFASRRDPHLRGGLVHHFAVDPAYRETLEVARKTFPIELGTKQIVENCTTITPDFDPLRTETINSTALFGAGWIDRISTRAITTNRLRKGVDNVVQQFDLVFDTVPSGRARVLSDGRVGKFGWRGQFASLREFVAAACANELGLGNPVMEQAKPLARPDYPATKPDLDGKQFTALVAFVDTLARPVELVPENSQERASAERGKKVFHSVGCAICHVPNMGGVEGVYSDFLLHELEDRRTAGDGYGNRAPPPIPIPEGHPKPTEWKTPPLWGVADSAPYFHDGAAPTLEAAIARHRGDAEKVVRAYQRLPASDQLAVIGFLKTLRAPPPHNTAKDSVVAKR